MNKTLVKLGDLIEQIRGVSYKPTDLHFELDENSVTLLRANNINDGKLNFDDVVYVDKSKVKKEQYLKQGDIFICASSGSKELVGKATYITKDLEAVFGAFCKVVRLKNKEYAKYVGHYFNSQRYKSSISNASQGSNINNIRNEDIEELKFYWVENISDQHKIVATLDQLNDLISIKNQQLEQFDLLIKSRFVEMFGDPIRNTYHFPNKFFSELCEEIGDGLHGTPVYDDKGEFYFVNGNNLEEKTIIIKEDTKKVSKTEAEKHYIALNNQTILLSINGTLGKTAFYNGEKIILGKSACYCILKKDLNKHFIIELFNSDFWKDFMDINASATTIKNFGLKTLREFKMILPPLALQTQFADFVTEVEQQKSTVKQSLEELETLKKKLMQDYFG